MFACSECVGANQTGPTLMKLTTICDVSHVISYTRPSSPLFFSGGIERKAWERGYGICTRVVSRPLTGYWCFSSGTGSLDIDTVGKLFCTQRGTLCWPMKLVAIHAVTCACTAIILTIFFNYQPLFYYFSRTYRV